MWRGLMAAVGLAVASPAGAVTLIYDLNPFAGPDGVTVNGSLNPYPATTPRTGYQLLGQFVNAELSGFSITTGDLECALTASVRKCVTPITQFGSIRGYLDSTDLARLIYHTGNSTAVLTAQFQGTITQQPASFRPSFFDPGGIPEPATWAMMIGGFGAIGAALRRQPRRHAAATST